MDDFGREQQPEEKPLWIRKDSPKREKYEGLLSKTYKKDEICVFFQDTPSDQDITSVKDSLKDALKDRFKKKDLDPGEIDIRKCDHCNCPVVLFRGRELHSVINTEGVRAGSVPTPPVVGEEYSLNFYKSIPLDKWKGRNYLSSRPLDFSENTSKLVVAVLDTGIDTDLVDPRYLWKNTDKNRSSGCYKEAESGWNFVNLSSGPGNGSADFRDDHPDRHGTVVSQFIINEFRRSRRRSVQIMPLKTHDQDGVGDLFGILCAIYFAVANGAHIINASWGFYYYYENPFRFLSKIIALKLKEKGMLFITAAGNKLADEEDIAREIYQDEYGKDISDDQLRNLALHNFYPAHLSRGDGSQRGENSVITVTTTDGETVSPTQNYSRFFTDLGVLADQTGDDGAMKFQIPFPGHEEELVSGSSFAAAIATGLIGAYTPEKFFRPGIDKSRIFDFLSSRSGRRGAGPLLVEKQELAGKYIRNGACIRKTTEGS